jgi:hypothetical protein
MLRLLGFPPGHQALTERLPWPVQVELLIASTTPRMSKANWRDWLEIRENPKSGDGLWIVLAVLFAVIGVAGVAFAGFWQIEVMRGAAHLGLVWLYILSFCLFPLGVLLLGTGYFLDSVGQRSRYRNPRSLPGRMLKILADRDWDLMAVTGLVIALAGAIPDVATSGLVLSHWLNPAVVAAVLSGVTAAPLIFIWPAKRRDARFSNPLRDCYRASGRTSSDPTSVIAR